MDFRLPVYSRTEKVAPPVVMKALGYIYSLPLKYSIPDVAKLALLSNMTLLQAVFL